MGNFARVNTLWLWIEGYWFIVMPVGIITGLFLFFTQHQQSKNIESMTFFLVTMGTITSIVFFLFYFLIFQENSSAWIGWVILAIGIIISLPFCYLSLKYLPFACIVCAIPAGTCLAFVLQVAVIYMIQFQNALYITIGALCLVFIVIGLMFQDHAINILNAITASYVIMRCIGLIMSYPYELVIYSELHVYKTREGFVSSQYIPKVL